MGDRLQSVELPAGKVIGGCRVQHLIGRGGMGEVYLAHHLSLDKPVALKILPPSKIDRDHVGRFLQEARVCARIEHPNVVPIYNVGEEAGNYFIVMQYVEGKNLAEIVQAQGGPLPWRPALKLFRLAAKGVAAVHQRGVIHRDIKPSNIMVSNESRVLLMDFGLAREESRSELTRTGALLGTPAFMSPEQCLDQSVDRRSDIYSLGCTLYYLLTGGVPFQGSVQSVLAQIGSGQTPVPVYRLNPYVPTPVSDFVARAMAFRPGNRFSDAGELARVAGSLLSSPEVSGMRTAETADMSGLSTSIKIVPELAPVELIPYNENETVERTLSVTRGLLWGAGGVVAVLLLVILALTLNILFGGREAGPQQNKGGAARAPQAAGGKNFAPAQPAGGNVAANAADARPSAEQPEAPSTPTPAARTGPVDTKSMVHVPAGKARLGEDPEKLKRFFATEGPFPAEAAKREAMVAQAISQYDEPRELVDVAGFWIDKYEVTNIEYFEFIKETGHRRPSFWNGASPPAGTENQPVTHVNYDDAAAYARWSGKQLPTVAQWMRAFRGEKDQFFPWGDAWDRSRANVGENKSFPTIASVQATPRDISSFGVFNMVGAVREMMREQIAIGRDAGGNAITATLLKGSDWSQPGTVYGIGGWRMKWIGGQVETVQVKAIGFRCVWEADAAGRTP